MSYNGIPREITAGNNPSLLPAQLGIGRQQNTAPQRQYNAPQANQMPYLPNVSNDYGNNPAMLPQILGLVPRKQAYVAPQEQYDTGGGGETFTEEATTPVSEEIAPVEEAEASPTAESVAETWQSRHIYDETPPDVNLPGVLGVLDKPLEAIAGYFRPTWRRSRAVIPATKGELPETEEGVKGALKRVTAPYEQFKTAGAEWGERTAGGVGKALGTAGGAVVGGAMTALGGLTTGAVEMAAAILQLYNGRPTSETAQDLYGLLNFSFEATKEHAQGLALMEESPEERQRMIEAGGREGTTADRIKAVLSPSGITPADLIRAVDITRLPSLINALATGKMSDADRARMEATTEAQKKIQDPDRLGRLLMGMPAFFVPSSVLKSTRAIPRIADVVTTPGEWKKYRQAASPGTSTGAAEQALKRIEAGEDPEYVLNTTPVNPLVELGASIALDPLNLAGGALTKKYNAVRNNAIRVRFVERIPETKAQVADLVKARNVKVASRPWNITQSTTVSRRTELANNTTSVMSNIMKLADSDERVAAQLVNEFRENPDAFADNHNTPWAASRASKEAAVLMDAIKKEGGVENTILEAVGEAEKEGWVTRDANGQANVVKGKEIQYYDHVSKGLMNLLSKATEEVIPEHKTYFDRLAEPVLKAKAPLDKVFATAFLGMNEAYALRNAFSNLTHVTVDGFLPTEAAPQLNQIIRRWGGLPLEATHGITPVGTPSTGKTTLWNFAIHHAQAFERWFSLRVTTRAMVSSFMDLWRPRYEEAIKALENTGLFPPEQISGVRSLTAGALNSEEIRSGISKLIGGKLFVSMDEVKFNELMKRDPVFGTWVAMNIRNVGSAEELGVFMKSAFSELERRQKDATDPGRMIAKGADLTKDTAAAMAKAGVSGEETQAYLQSPEYLTMRKEVVDAEGSAEGKLLDLQGVASSDPDYLNAVDDIGNMFAFIKKSQTDLYAPWLKARGRGEVSGQLYKDAVAVIKAQYANFHRAIDAELTKYKGTAPISPFAVGPDAEEALRNLARRQGTQPGEAPAGAVRPQPALAQEGVTPREMQGQPLFQNKKSLERQERAQKASQWFADNKKEMTVEEAVASRPERYGETVGFWIDRDGKMFQNDRMETHEEVIRRAGYVASKMGRDGVVDVIDSATTKALEDGAIRVMGVSDAEMVNPSSAALESLQEYWRGTHQMTEYRNRSMIIDIPGRRLGEPDVPMYYEIQPAQISDPGFSLYDDLMQRSLVRQEGLGTTAGVDKVVAPQVFNDLARAREVVGKAFNIDSEKAGAVTAILKVGYDRAVKLAGVEAADEYLSSYRIGRNLDMIDVLSPEELELIRQTNPRAVYKPILTPVGIQRIVTAFTGSEVSSGIHELFHGDVDFWVDLVRTVGKEDPDLVLLEKYAGDLVGEVIVDHEWTSVHKETMATAFEHYMRTLEAPTPELKNVFQKIAAWMKDIYDAMTGGYAEEVKGMEMNPELRQLLDRVYGEEMGKALMQPEGAPPIEAPGRGAMPPGRPPVSAAVTSAAEGPIATSTDTSQLLQSYAEMLQGVASGIKLSNPVNATPQQVVALRAFYKSVTNDMAPAKIAAERIGVAARNFALLDYSDRRSIDSLLNMFLIYPYWSSRTYPNWIKRILLNPGIAGAYLRYQEDVRKQNEDLPEWLQDKLRIKVPGLPEPIYVGVRSLVDPLYNLYQSFEDKSRTPTGLLKVINTIDQAGFSPYPLLAWAYAAERASKGDVESAESMMGHFASITRATRYISGKLGINEGMGFTVEPWLWRGGLGIGGDKWEIRRATRQLSYMESSGEITSAEAREAARAMSTRDFSHPLVKEALKREIDDKALPTLVSWVSGLPTTIKTEDEAKVDMAETERADMWEKRADMTDDEWSAANKKFYQKYPYMSTLNIARADREKADTSWSWDVLNRIPPGESSDALAAALVSQKSKDAFYANKGFVDKNGKQVMTPMEKMRFMAAMLELSTKYDVPTPAMSAQWQEVKRLYNKMKVDAETKFPGTLAQETQYYAVKAKDPAGATTYLAQNPGLKKRWDYIGAYKKNDQLLQFFYGDTPREQAIDVLWSAYFATGKGRSKAFGQVIGTNLAQRFLDKQYDKISDTELFNAVALFRGTLYRTAEAEGKYAAPVGESRKVTSPVQMTTPAPSAESVRQTLLQR